MQKQAGDQKKSAGQLGVCLAFLEHYNLRRSHQGYRLGGRTPAQALCEALAIDGELPSLTGGFIVAEGEEVSATVAA